MRCAGLLLTGGTSSRLGRDKASVPWDGRTLAQRAAAALAAVTSPTLEAGPGGSGLPAVDDPRLGPLAALAAALPHLPPDRHLILLACDLPLVEAPLLRWLADHPALGSVVPLAPDPGDPPALPDPGDPAAPGGAPDPAPPAPAQPDPPGGALRPQPLCARWSPAATGGVAALVAAGQRSLHPLLHLPDVVRVPPDAWSPAAAPWGTAALDDVDTPAALDRLRHLAGMHSP
ncbi:MAG TPA: NTP transferase domain-containing protein [Acidimicrobiales bacterium]